MYPIIARSKRLHHVHARPRGGGTDYYVKIDSDKFDFNEKDKEALWGRERIHPAPAPATPRRQPDPAANLQPWPGASQVD